MVAASFGCTGGTAPEPFEQGLYIQIDAVAVKGEGMGYVNNLRGTRSAFDCGLREAVAWVRDSAKPFIVPRGPYPVQEAERIAAILKKYELVVTLVDANNDPLPPPRTVWERLGE